MAMTFDPLAFGHHSLPGMNLPETLSGCLVTGLLGIDPAGRVWILTPEAESLLKVAASQTLNQPIEVLPHPLPELLREALDTGKHLANQVLWLENPPANRRGLQVTLSPVAREDGRGLMVMIKNLDALQRLETHLRRMDRLASIGTMSASVAHEIKNALTPLKTFVDLANEERPGSEFGLLVRREMDRVAGLVGQMLRFAGPDRPAVEKVHAHVLLERSLKLLQHLLEGKRIVVDASVKARHDLVLVDAYQIEQAFLNVLINAIEAMDHGGRICITTSETTPDSPNDQPSQLRIEISDSGHGIEPEDMEHLFDTFFTTKPDGTGLGLAVTRRILREHQGDIEIESSPRHGTRVILVLPLVDGTTPKAGGKG